MPSNSEEKKEQLHCQISIEPELSEKQRWGDIQVLYVARQVLPIMPILKIGSSQSLNREDATFVSHGSPPGSRFSW